MFELKRKKMLEKEIAKLEGQMVLLEQQRMMIQCKYKETNKLMVDYSLADEKYSMISLFSFNR